MNITDIKFQQVLKHIIDTGEKLTTRNSDAIRTHFPMVLYFDRTPLVSIRRTAWKNALREWEWFMSGSCNIKDLHPSVRKWWHPWADPEGNIANNYSMQFRSASGNGIINYDQIEGLIQGLIDQPSGRRHVITTWNAAEMNHPNTPITNCHNTLTQFFVDRKGALHLTTYQRSCDMVLGVPHNWIQEWAFLLWVAHKAKLSAGSMCWISGDAHIYASYLAMADRIISLNPKDYEGTEHRVPQLIYSPTSDKFKADDFSLDGDYKSIIKESLELIV